MNENTQTAEAKAGKEQKLEQLKAELVRQKRHLEVMDQGLVNMNEVLFLTYRTRDICIRTISETELFISMMEKGSHD